MGDGFWRGFALGAVVGVVAGMTGGAVVTGVAAQRDADKRRREAAAAWRLSREATYARAFDDGARAQFKHLAPR